MLGGSAGRLAKHENLGTGLMLDERRSFRWVDDPLWAICGRSYGVRSLLRQLKLKAAYTSARTISVECT